jgi:2-haloacid dehalogenase
MKKYDTFLVDADDTLLDFHASSHGALIAAFENFHIQWREEYADEFFTFNDLLWQRLERKELTRERLHAERFPAYLKRLGIKGVDGGEFNKQYLSYLATHPVYMAGAEEFLKTLSGAGRVYLVTNGTYWIQRSRFQILGIMQYVQEAFISESIGCDKPRKAYTDYVLTHIPDFQKDKTVWVGDSLSADIKAANDAEIDCVWFNPTKKSANGKDLPDFEAETYAKILDILQIS